MKRVDRHRRSIGVAIGVTIAAMIACAPTVARADDPEAARAAYDRGAAAFSAKRYAEAATELARADALAPNPVALASALKAAELADDPVLAMTLADRAELRPGVGDKALAAARHVRDKLGARVGKLSVRCAAPRGCAVTVDAEPFAAEQLRWVKAGAHAIEVASGGRVARYTVTVDGGKTVAWEEPGAAPAIEPPKAEPPKAEPPKAEPPKPEPPKPGAPARGISPAWFAVGAGLTAIAGGVSIWSGVDTLGKHADFESRVTDDPSSGKAAQTRTNILFGVMGAAIATTLIGALAVRWSKEPSPAPRVAIAAGPMGASLHAQF